MKSMKTMRMQALRSGTGRQIILVLAALCICCVIAAGIAPGPVSAAEDSTHGVAQIAPLKPQLTGTLIMPTQILFCQNFSFNVTVINYGNAPARNAHLYFQQFPGDFFALLNVDQASASMGNYIQDIDIGSLAPNEQRTVNFVVYTPFQKQLRAEWLRKFYFNFSAAYDYAPEELLGRVLFLAGNGKIQVQRTGFTQK